MNMFSMLAPVIGGLLYDHLDYDHTMNAHIFIELTFAVIFICFNCSRDVFKKDKELKLLKK